MQTPDGAAVLALSIVLVWSSIEVCRFVQQIAAFLSASSMVLSPRR